MDQQKLEIADQIIKDLKLEGLEDPLKTELIESIKDRIAQKTLLVLMESIPDSEIPALEQAVAKKGEEAAIQEMANRIPDINTKLSQALGHLYEEIVNDAKAAMESFSTTADTNPNQLTSI